MKEHWTRGKAWINRPKSVIVYCQHYIHERRRHCYNPERGRYFGNSCYFALSYNPEDGIDCELLDKRVKPDKPECTEYDFIKKLLEVV